MLDSHFGVPTIFYNGTVTWWDMPSDRHNRGANLTLADGHVDHWRWATIKVPGNRGTPTPVSPGEMPDWNRVAAAIKQTMYFGSKASLEESTVRKPSRPAARPGCSSTIA